MAKYVKKKCTNLPGIKQFHSCHFSYFCKIPSSGILRVGTRFLDYFKQLGVTTKTKQPLKCTQPLP